MNFNILLKESVLYTLDSHANRLLTSQGRFSRSSNEYKLPD